ncbi:MAG TPA: DUF4381 domain-containing protein [Xanthomonadaceae bacterium]|nr:DUF4381 domain-containing protein [Xanthomonadaceae bacterium]
MQGPTLRDIHWPPEPSWWPPAPGWWLLAVIAAGVLWLLVRALLRTLRRWRRRVAVDALFDATLARAGDDGRARIAAVSHLLRRACRVREAPAAAVGGEAWLHFLDGEDPQRPFSQGPGRVLLEAPFRPTAVPVDEQVLELARARLHELAGTRQ